MRLTEAIIATYITLHFIPCYYIDTTSTEHWLQYRHLYIHKQNKYPYNMYTLFFYFFAEIRELPLITVSSALSRMPTYDIGARRLLRTSS